MVAAGETVLASSVGEAFAMHDRFHILLLFYLNLVAINGLAVQRLEPALPWHLHPTFPKHTVALDAIYPAGWL